MSTTDDYVAEFAEKGYTVAPADRMDPLHEIRTALCREAATLLDTSFSDPEAFLDDFHSHGLEGGKLNDFRVELIRRFNASVDCARLLWEAYESVLLRLCGADVAVQKSTNLVIQMPDDPSVSPAHRDAPPNSTYEVVVWMPFARCYGTKGMAVLDRDQTREVMGLIDGDAPDYEKFRSRSAEIGTPAEMEFGSALFFWAGLVHTIPVNVEPETRWSLNTRYKNIYTPYGTKGMPDYFVPLALSPLARLALDAEKTQELTG